MQKKAKKLNLKISKARKLKKGIHVIACQSPYLAKHSRPGNFLQIKTGATILRRPLSIHKVEKNQVFILFRVRGRGTQALAGKKEGESLDVLGPLGRGFKVNRKGQPVLIAGGIGIAPLLFLAQTLKKAEQKKAKLKQKKGILLLGAASAGEIVAKKEFQAIGFEVKVATDDGSKGKKGPVTGLLPQVLESQKAGSLVDIYACGPKEMFFEIKKIISGNQKIKGQISFEQLMGCGTGVCSACTTNFKSGPKKVCRDGPVFDIKEI